MKIIYIIVNYFTMNSLTRLLKDNDFTDEEISITCSKGVNEATSARELWAHWFSCHCKNDDEFISERLKGLRECNIKFIMDIVHLLNEE